MSVLANETFSRLVDGAPRITIWILVVALAISSAWWTWRLVPLSGAVLTGVAGRVDLAGLSTQGWFATDSAVAGAASSSRYVLRWVYSGKPGVCILGLPGLADKTFRVGDEVEAGFKLREVGADYVVIEGGGGEERIERAKEPPPVPAPVPAAATQRD